MDQFVRCTLYRLIFRCYRDIHWPVQNNSLMFTASVVDLAKEEFRADIETPFHMLARNLCNITT